jgi:hypothetical protein
MRNPEMSVIGHRSFLDQHGVRWHVWEVYPTSTDRRASDDREAITPGADEAILTDRRFPFERRATIDPELANGWLAFESEIARRRYAPIPRGWTGLPSRELCRLLQVAKEVRVASVEYMMSPPRGTPLMDSTEQS